MAEWWSPAAQSGVSQVKSGERAVVVIALYTRSCC